MYAIKEYYIHILKNILCLVNLIYNYVKFLFIIKINENLLVLLHTNTSYSNTL